MDLTDFFPERVKEILQKAYVLVILIRVKLCKIEIYRVY